MKRISALATAVLAVLLLAFSPTPSAQAQNWDRLLDTVILRFEPADADGNTTIDPTDHHILDAQGSTEEAAVIFDEANRRVRSAGGPIRLIEIVHSQDGAGGETPADGAAIRADIASPRGCTYFTDPTGAEEFGLTMTGMSDAAGRFVGPAVVPPGACPPGLSLWPDSHTGDSPQRDYDIGDIWVDTYCEEQATITIRVGYQDTTGPVPPDEWFGVNWLPFEPVKQPQVRWAGEDIVLERRWALPNAYFPNGDLNGDTVISAPEDVCPLASSVSGSLVKYSKMDGPGSLVSGLPDVAAPGGGEPDAVWTTVDDSCISRALYSSEGPGQVGVEAALRDSDLNLVNRHAFLIWYLKIYQVKLTNVVGARSGHDAGMWRPEPTDPGADTETDMQSVLDDALLRVQVKGWFWSPDPSGRPDICIDMDGDGDGAGSEAGAPYQTLSHGGCELDDEVLDHGYWVLPDDLPALAGPNPNKLATWDVMDDPGDDTSGYPANVIGIESTLDSHGVIPRPSVPCLDPFCPRKTFVPDGEITRADAVMPALRITAQINHPAGAGFFKEANKVLDLGLDNAYGSTMIPYEPEIPPSVSNGGYEWDSWGFSGPIMGPYRFFDVVAILAAPGPLANTGLGNQGGQSVDDPTHPRMIQLYTDNRGQGFFFANGNYNLSFDGCDILSPDTPECSPGDVVGVSEVTVIGDYPYFRKHPAVQSNQVDTTWTWGGAAVGGTFELRPAVAGPRAPSVSGSQLPYAVFAGVAVAAVALATAAWCVRRRWLP